ncbi:unnamed protein product [Chilo suppressalis]|uniref:KANL2-like probable zinc-finger domain-containing protein n=1 Tax=Chilo suppressalis TaxID=168631 RepID=A0ABN8L6G6_CHISP|nr:unnamed protein product [Chilo suppressalis]
MSYLSASENVGFSGIPQNISDASCATQYKMAVEGVAGSCSGDVNMYIQDSSGDEQSYITHLNDNFFHTKFKIDPNELYTFHDSDVIASEITVSHTEDAFVFSENVDAKGKMLDSPSKDIDLVGTLANGEIKEEIKLEIPNGHYTSLAMSSDSLSNSNSTVVDTKIQKIKSNSAKEANVPGSVAEVRRANVPSPKGQNSTVASIPSNKSSISNSNLNSAVTPSTSKLSGSETFLDVFKREQGLVENIVIKSEPAVQPSVKIPFPTPKKPHTGKASSHPKSRKGRGPAVHEALQRISTKRAIPIPIKSWHAPGEELFDCGPLADRKGCRQVESSSSDDDAMPEFDLSMGPVCVEETAAESRAARLALRRAALRRHVLIAGTEMRFTGHHKEQRSLATLIKKQLNSRGSGGNLPPQTINHLLALRGMPMLLSSNERRQLRENGWSGGESGSMSHTSSACCAEERCSEAPLPCGQYCLSHVTLAPEQRLYAACAAVFAGGARCKQPLLPLQDQTPLCPEHAWKRDNYDKLARDCRPKKTVRKRIWAAPARPPRKAKRRRRPPVRPPPPAPRPRSPHAIAAQTPTAEQSLSEINVCSNSSAYDSSEDAAMGALSENEYITVANSSHDLEVEVEHAPHDDILDPSVLSQIPDEAFTEFFNQAEGGTNFAESSELAAALEAVLDERVLDERVMEDNITDSVFLHTAHAQLKTKVREFGSHRYYYSGL